MLEFLKENTHWIGLVILTLMFVIANIFTRKELPFKQAKEKIVAMAILVSKVDGKRVLGDVEKEFMMFMNKHCDEFLNILRSKRLVSLRENINIDDIRLIGRLFAEFKAKVENKFAVQSV